MFCSRCGAQIEEANTFCPLCGQAVGSSGPIPPVSGSAPVSPPLAYGGFWARFVAYVIDGFVVGIPFLLVATFLFFLFGGFRWMARQSVTGPADTAFAGMLVFGVSSVTFLYLMAGWLYFALMESSARQATLGKAAMSLYVTNLGGRRLTLGHATGRFFAKIVSAMVPLAIGYIMAGFTEKKQALHDMIAATLVLKKS
jgi:uncharacterized RDD family membrane protein YckC